MKKIKYILFFVPAAVLLTLAFCFKVTEKNESVLSQALVDVLENYHYKPKQVNDDFSKEFFSLYIKRLDAGKRFFIEPNIVELSEFQNDIDNQLRSGEYKYFDKVNEIHSKRVLIIEKWYEEILSKPFDFKEKEFLVFNEDSSQYISDDIQLKEFWRKYLKQQTLEKLARKISVQEKAESRKDTVFKVKSYDTLELESRREVVKTQKDWFTRLKKFDRQEKLSLYFNCLSEMFDPHTNYFPPKDKENFDIRMSGKLEGIGAQLQEKDGLIRVVSIVPGSPSYKQGQLKPGYIIVKVAQGAGEPVDVTNMKIDDAIQLIRGKKGSEVRLTVKKPDETFIVIPIIRDVVEMEDSYAKSAIVDFKGKKYGYIYLPSFYLDMNNRGGRSCANDIKIEIEKLKKDDVKGIILDLRDNGGGSLQDVVDIGGFFIDKGPITQVKSRDRKPEILSDNNSGMIWEGPLTIMVNENSASASEILAAAMQDYKRALIIGSSTFGKGTVQRFIDLDDAFSAMSPEKMGSLKITIQKFYRIDGTTTQQNGVIPDVIIPDRYQYIEYGEKEQDYSLQADKISNAIYKVVGGYAEQIESAKEKSQKRIAANPMFNEIENMSRKIQKQNKKTSFTLNLKEYMDEMTQNEIDNKRYEELTKKVEPIKLINSRGDDKFFKDDSLKLRIKNDWNKSLEKDIYIHEAVNILKEF
ncbi:MAG: carboxy terminal-processing peptidase [Bacteroidota bacterium]|nr:carboxy terminal-processing peptidase [Bacteroidota bacterium]